VLAATFALASTIAHAIGTDANGPQVVADATAPAGSPTASPVTSTGLPGMALLGGDRLGLAGALDPSADGSASILAATPAPAVVALPAPEIVRFRPRGGAAGVVPTADLSVRFTTAMDRASTAGAFSATVIGGKPIRGKYWWAEGGTVLVLTTASSMPWGARVRLAVTTNAVGADGLPLRAAGSVTFTVMKKPVAASASSTGWQWPLLGPITQYFGQTLTKYGYHEGLDIDGNTGDPVRAAHAGRVIVAGRVDSCGGLQIRIDQGGELVSWYRHLSRINVRVGQTVKAGAIIGLVGNTGCSLGSHLDYAIRRGTIFVDPIPYLPRR
jgi:murein DD-endopeptidase MepM/ murein hydrolase activator NlpD